LSPGVYCLDMSMHFGISIICFIKELNTNAISAEKNYPILYRLKTKDYVRDAEAFNEPEDFTK